MINTEILGISVHIFLPQGVTDGVRIAQIPGWTGRIVHAPAHAQDPLAERLECYRAGLHLFIVGDDNDNDIIRMAVSSDLEVSLPYRVPNVTRLKHIVLITDRDDVLTGPELHWIGYLLRADIQAAGRSIREEDLPGGVLISETGRANIERFMEHVRIALPAMGII